MQAISTNTTDLHTHRAVLMSYANIHVAYLSKVCGRRRPGRLWMKWISSRPGNARQLHPSLFHVPIHTENSLFTCGKHAGLNFVKL
jgi:hypothetical protein